jgi:hypothetical protein
MKLLMSNLAVSAPGDVISCPLSLAIRQEITQVALPPGRCRRTCYITTIDVKL